MRTPSSRRVTRASGSPTGVSHGGKAVSVRLTLMHPRLTRLIRRLTVMRRGLTRLSGRLTVMRGWLKGLSRGANGLSHGKKVVTVRLALVCS